MLQPRLQQLLSVLLFSFLFSCYLVFCYFLLTFLLLGRVYEGSTLVHNTPLLSGQVKVSVDEVKDADAAVPVPTAEVSLVGQTLHTFLAWPTHLMKSLSQQVLIVLILYVSSF